MNKVNIINAGLKLQRAKTHGEYDPVSGYSKVAIIEYLKMATLEIDADIAEAAAACLRRHGFEKEAGLV